MTISPDREAVMRGHPVRAALWFVAMGALLAFGSCSDSSPAPTPIQMPGPGAATATIVNLEMDAPESVAPGATAQLTVRALKSDGSSEILTSGVVWTSNRSDILQVDGRGVATARRAGDTQVTARYTSLSASRGILVVPTGTYRLSGHVTAEGLPISGASVTVIAGTGEGLTAVTDPFYGAYVLYGVAGSIKLHIKKAGFQNLTQDIHVSENTTITGSMASEGPPRAPLGGQYRLTLAAADCSSIPSELTRRTYDATVEQEGARVTVRLTGANFIVTGGKGNSFSGIYRADGSLLFTLGFAPDDYFYYYSFQVTPDIMERVSETSALIINGSVASAYDGNGRIAGRLRGAFNIANQLTPRPPPYATACWSFTHSFELRRR